MLRTRVSSAFLIFSCSFPLVAQSTPEAPEPNEDVATATVLPCRTHGYGNLDAAGADVDLWAFTLPAASDVTIYTTSRGAVRASNGGSSADDTVLELLDVDGVTVLASNDDHTDRSFEDSGFFSKVFVQNLPAGTYYAKVTGWSPIETGDYVVEVFCDPVTPTLVFCDTIVAGNAESEPNDVFTDTGVLAANCCEAATGTLSTVGDDDWWSLTLVDDATIIWDLEGDATNGNELIDPLLEVYEADGTTLIGWDDDAGLGLNPHLELTLAAGTYAVRVRGVGPVSLGFPIGDYVLTTNCAADSVTLATIAVTADASACLTTAGTYMRVVRRTNEWLRLGGEFRLDIDGIPTVAVMLFGFEPFLTPVDLGLLGAPGCPLNVRPDFPAIPVVPTIDDEAEFGFFVPFDVLNLQGRGHMQAVSIDSGANALGLVTSNRLEFQVGDDA